MKNPFTTSRSLFIRAIALLYIFLFVYTATSKLLEFEEFRVQLAQSPLLSAYAGLIAPAVIISELLIAGLLSFKLTRSTALYAALCLMLAFTAYIYIILHYSDFVPCSCGGIIEKLGWTEHLIFNIGFAILALVAIVAWEKDHKTPARTMLFKILFPSLVAVAVVSGLFLSSEHIIKKENNFIRRFNTHLIHSEKLIALGAADYYFAGMANGRIYLGNRTTPLLLTMIDTSFSGRQCLEVKLDHYDHPFRSIQVKVLPSGIYLYDGTVPVIYRAALDDSIARTISYADCYFSQLQVVDSLRFVIRAQSSESKSWVLGTFDPGRDPKVYLNDQLLKKQIDGIFDTDGQLLLDNQNGELVYIFSYRNEILVMDQELKLRQHLHTIDTIARAQIQVRSLSDGTYKMSVPPLRVNRTSALHGQVLFNESMLMGKFESREMWQEASIIDLYRTDQQEYLGSFYIYHRGENTMSQMLATSQHLFVLSGNEIVRYHFAQEVMSHFKTGEAENLEQSR